MMWAPSTSTTAGTATMTSTVTSTGGSTESNQRIRTVNGQNIMLGQLPDDFLRLNSSSSTSDHVGQNQNQMEIDEQLAASLQQQYNHQAQRRAQWASHYQALLEVTCVEARLTKNYGIVNMNPYIRLRLGHTIFETKTSHKGGKNPRWNETIRCYLPKGVNTLSIEIYDECLLTSDDLIAWASYKIPQEHLTFNAESPHHTIEETITLSGKQGEDKEGILMMVFTFKPITAAMSAASQITVAPAIYHHQTPGPYILSGSTIVNPPVIVHQTMQPATTLMAPPVNPIKDEDVKNLKEMFPKIEVDVIKSVLTAERGNLDRAINHLLELNSTTP